MFGLDKLTRKKPQNNGNEYVTISSIIEEGSVLDRRKPRNDRRLHPDRRKILGTFVADEEQRIVKYRREIQSRRGSDLKKDETIENIDEMELTENNIQTLIREQILFIEELDKLSLSVKEMEFQGVKEEIKKYVASVRFQVKKEQHFLRLYIDKDAKDLTDEETVNSLSDFNTDIYNVSAEVLQLLEKYSVKEVKANNAGFFLMDMNNLRTKLTHCLERKQNHLYPKYFRCLK